MEYLSLKNMPENSWYIKRKYFSNPLMSYHLHSENCYFVNGIKFKAGRRKRNRNQFIKTELRFLKTVSINCLISSLNNY